MLTLSGVLKDILLVVASMVIFQDPVAPLQFFGYSIALGGLVWYKLGADGVKNGLRDSQLAFAQMRQNNPARAKGLVLAAVLIGAFLVMYSFFPSLMGISPKTPFTG